jgi:hypothetical protein
MFHSNRQQHNGCVHRAAVWLRLSRKPQLGGSGATFVRRVLSELACICPLTDLCARLSSHMGSHRRIHTGCFSVAVQASASFVEY